jgi:hypothetical protein
MFTWVELVNTMRHNDKSLSTRLSSSTVRAARGRYDTRLVDALCMMRVILSDAIAPSQLIIFANWVTNKHQLNRQKPYVGENYPASAFMRFIMSALAQVR